MELRSGHHLRHGRVGRLIGTGNQQRITGGHDPLGDRRHLARRLAGAKDNFRESLPDGAVMIHTRKSEVLERQPPQHGGQLRGPLIGGRGSARNPFENVPQLILIHAGGAAVCD